MLKKNGRVARATGSAGKLSLASVIASILGAHGAHAQSAPTPQAIAETDTEAQTVVITGSRIATSELQTMTPVTVVTSQAIESSGQLNISDYLRDLPSVGTSALSTTNSNFLTNNAGINTINLRNLGDSRTLVLVNGKRYTPGVSGTTQVDFNTIPTDFIDHIEVTTGGASAIYGSDAVAGVVNVIYKTNFQGVQLRGQGGQTGSNDDARYGGGFLAGSSFDEGRGQFMFDISWDKDDGLWSRQRKISAVDETVLTCQPCATNGVLTKPTFSSFVPQGRFEYTDTQGNVDNLFTFNPDGSLKNGFSSKLNGFDRSPYRRISVPIDRTLVATTLNFDVSEHSQIYSELTYGFNHTKSSIEPLPLSGAGQPSSVYGYSGATGPAVDANGDLIAIPVTNAYLQTLPVLAPVAQFINNYNATGTNCVGSLATNPNYDCINYVNFRKRMIDVAVRSNEANRQTGRLLLGTKGDIPLGDWKYDVSYSYGRTTDSQLTTGEINLANMRASLDSVVNASGQIVCRDPVWQALGCVPVNPFGFNSITPAAANWIRANQTRDVKVQEQVISASVSGSVGHLPAGDPQLVVGVEHRKDSSEEIWDALTNAGLNGGNQIPNTYGSITAKEAFVEAQVPVLKGLPGVDALDVNAAYRHAKYSTVGGVNTWKAGLDWAPVPDVRFRGVYSVAIRAPDINELYGGLAETFPSGLVDPCDGITQALLNQGKFSPACTKIPAIAAAIANGGQFKYSSFDYQSINGFIGANPNLHQEKAKTTTLGLVFTPRALPHFNATVDFFDVNIQGAVNVVDFQTEINQCLAASLFCDSVIRNPATGKLTTVNQINLNVAAIRTRGIDTVLRYGFDFGAGGALSLEATETHLIKLEQRVPGAPTLDNVGELNSGANGRLGSGFEDRGTFAAVYDIAGLEATWRITYMSSIDDTTPTASNTVISTIYNGVPAYVYHDAQLRYTLPFKPKAQVYLGVNNMFNKKPPFLPMGMASTVTGTETAADTYDVFGVFWYAGFNVKF